MKFSGETVESPKLKQVDHMNVLFLT